MTYRIGLILACAPLFIACGETPAPTANVVDAVVMDLDAAVDAATDTSFARDLSMGADQGGIVGSGCERNEDCNSGYCVHGPDGERVCTNRCANDDDCPEDDVGGGFSCEDGFCKPGGGGVDVSPPDEAEGEIDL